MFHFSAELEPEGPSSTQGLVQVSGTAVKTVVPRLRGRCSVLPGCQALLTPVDPLVPSSTPHKDLEQYAASYSGLMRIERLQFIADRCPPLRVEALKMALSFVQRTFNVDMYEEIHRKLSEATR